MNIENVKYIFDSYPTLDKVFIAPDEQIFLPKDLHLAKSHCIDNKLKMEDIKEYTRTAFNQDYTPVVEEKPLAESTENPPKTAKK